MAKVFGVYRKRERYQVPLAVALASLTLALLLPPFPMRRAREASRAAAVLALLLAPTAAGADTGQVTGEVLLRPKRLTQSGRKEFERGNHPAALEAFEKAAQSRPADPAARFNLADALYKNGKLDEAASLYGSLAAPGSALAPAAAFNLGNTLFQKQDYRGAVDAYKNTLRMAPGDPEAMNNLEMALRALQQQKQQQDQKDQQQKQDQPQDQERPQQSRESKDQDPKQKPQPGQQPEPPKTEEEKENERFQKQTGMPKERAMQLLDALQQNEKDEQKRLLAAKQPKKRPARDW